MPAFADRLLASIATTALGLPVGLASLWWRRYLTGRVEVFDGEMRAASLGLINQLASYRGPWTVGSVSERSMFGA